MYVKREIDFEDLENLVWSGATNTIEVVKENEKEEELMTLIEENFDECPTETELNDFLWFEDEFIFEQLGIETED